MPDERRICIVDANILFDFLAGGCIDLLFTLPFDFRTSDIVAYLISGDGALRDFSKAHSIECHGTIWFLEMMLHENIINHSKAATILKKMLDFARPPRRLPRTECEKRIRKWESVKY